MKKTQFNKRLLGSLALLLLGCATPSNAAVPTQDERLGLHSDGGVWGIQWQEEIDPSLPNVLLVGDSILIGYQGHVRRNLVSKANVDIWTTPEHLNSPNLHKNLCKALATRDHYDVVHFNIGLHGWAAGRIPEGQYGSLFKKYIEVIQETNPDAEIIWVSTTPIHTQNGQTLNAELNPIIVERNAIAAGICNEEGIPVNDLYGLTVQHLDLVRGDRFHWQAPVYELIAEQSIAVIEEALAK
ncbi:SGNH/GDSL hydrolase family protein [Coraliomargarita sp. SDUM461004]|uniref:SGNH/GDSL hydrolase family protein n=1 Tax=Thalassobacterium sedimentorum TaxID=3041258 RepID=A0ABU1AGY5_9BACT|nr:SGNH/GDSL hydrolase family protein [Coraliomargarita sp. SDUM461004]MDQ8192893.1 SGNH/GDSL hydrolase family protein [Coraliomargarita sp. SDUM461004]